MNTELLNELQGILISWANKEGISLADHFASVEDFKLFVVALAVRGLKDAGADTADAIDMVLGANTLRRISDGIWDKFHQAV